MFSQPSYIIDQGCQTRELLGAILHVGNRAEGRMMFFDLEIFASSGNGLCNVARRVVDLQKKVIRGKEGFRFQCRFSGTLFGFLSIPLSCSFCYFISDRSVSKYSCFVTSAS